MFQLVSEEMFFVEISDLLSELDALRLQRGMSYQAVADACGVSKATIYRTLTGATEPTIQLVKRIEAAVQYVPPSAGQQPPASFSKEEYAEFLRETIIRQDQEYSRHITQLQTHYSLLRRQDRRAIAVLAAAVAVLVIFLVVWLVLDILHPGAGWISAS